MREVLVGWVSSVHHHLGLESNTLYLAVGLLDRFSSVRQVSRGRYQLLGLTCLFIAAKYEEVKMPKLRDFVKMISFEYDKKSVLETEAEVLVALGVSVTSPTRYWFMEEYLQYVDFCP